MRKDGLENMKAITYDPVNDVFYFTDRKHPQTSVFSLKLREDATFLITPLVPRSEKEVIEDLVYDVHDKTLYWSDSGNKRIVKLVFDRSKNLKWQKETFLNISGDISGLELDSCQRNLYYTLVTDSSPSINVVSIDKKDSKPVSFGSENHFRPVAIAMDHQQRRLYVADIRMYNSYSIDSIFTNGTEFRTEIDKTYKTPRSIAVDGEYVYYVEGSDHELRRFAKNSDAKTSEAFKVLPYDPNDIIVKSNFVIDLDPEKCKVPASKIKQVREEIQVTALKKETPNKMCLHGGSLDKTTSNCMCMENYDGDFCEINLCYNFCLNGGDCSMDRNEKSQKLEPKCSCKRGFVGEHCEVDVCSNYCLHNGKCTVGHNKKAKCECDENFNGARCEISKDETSPVLTDSHFNAKKDIEVSSTTNAPSVIVPDSSELHEINIHHELPENLIKDAENDIHQDILQCPQNNVNLTYVILAVCITISLMIFLVILVVIRKINRPMRPKIRKKYVVHKNIEPLTYRPTTEQCEVIIEDCCNMNICETVRFNRCSSDH